MSSKVGLIGQAAAPSYVTTKAGQVGLTLALALDLAPMAYASMRCALLE